MKNFEQRYNEWVDDTLPADEREALENQLDPEWKKAAEADRQLGDLMRSSLPSPQLHNTDFLNHSILETIRREAVPATAPADRFSWRNLLPQLPRPALAALAAAIVLGFFLILATRDNPDTPTDWLAGSSDHGVIQVSNTAPGIHASAFSDESENYAVLWVEGMKFIPAAHTIQ